MRNENDSDISILKINSTDDIYDIVRQGFSSSGRIELRSNSKVVIKPNLCAIKSHETGTTTDPRVVEEIIRYLKKEYGISDISIIESDGSQVLADVAFKLLGYEKLSKRLDVKVVNLSKSPFSVRPFPANTFLKKVRVPEIIEKADFFVSVPKIKTHSDCSLTCTLKNQFGCNPYSRKTRYHKRLDEAIVDLNTVFRPNMIVVDGIVAMDGCKGPTDGIPVRMNTLIFGRDPVAVDHLVAKIMGMDPKRVRYIVEAEKRGIGKTKYKTIGTDPDEIKRKFNIRPPRMHNLYGILRHDS